MERLSIIAIVFVTVWARAAGRAPLDPLCPLDFFHDTDLGRCVRCSACSDNKIIYEPCTPTADIVCGRFTEFSGFKFAEDSGNPLSDINLVDSDDVQEPSDRIESPRRLGNALVSGISNKWKIIAFSLVGLLCLLVVLIVVCSVTMCYRRCRPQARKNTIIFVDPG